MTTYCQLIWLILPALLWQQQPRQRLPTVQRPPTATSWSTSTATTGRPRWTTRSRTPPLAGLPVPRRLSQVRRDAFCALLAVESVMHIIIYGSCLVRIREILVRTLGTCSRKSRTQSFSRFSQQSCVPYPGSGAFSPGIPYPE
jgi:hypothetical protein